MKTINEVYEVGRMMRTQFSEDYKTQSRMAVLLCGFLFSFCFLVFVFLIKDLIDEKILGSIKKEKAEEIPGKSRSNPSDCLHITLKNQK